MRPLHKRLRASHNNGKSNPRYRHGGKGTSEYTIWRGMHDRCNNTKTSQYVNYGARGIRVCERWRLFENFRADMGPRPSKAHSIDRINNDGDYEPGNCRWATASEQGLNTRRTKFIEFRGRTMPLVMWAQEIGIRPTSLRERLEKWPLEEAMTAAPAPGSRRDLRR